MNPSGGSDAKDVGNEIFGGDPEESESKFH